jgi:hypothetical protein
MKGWERAAIVWAFTLEDDQAVSSDGKISFVAFAASASPDFGRT